MNVASRVIDAITQWGKTEVKDEWFFSNFRDSLLSSVDSEGAFLGIDEIVSILLAENDSDILIEIIEILITLARKSETTEMPPILDENWGTIIRKVTSLGDYAISRIDELAKYDRRTTR